MKCPHCIKEIHFEEYGSWAFEYEDNARLKSDQITGYSVTYTICPACSELIVLLQHGKIQGTPERQWLTDISVLACGTSLLASLLAGRSFPCLRDVPSLLAGRSLIY